MSTDINTLDLICKNLRVFRAYGYTVSTIQTHVPGGEVDLTSSVSQLLALAGWGNPRRGRYSLIFRNTV
jgi:hypothetical protein